MRRCGIPEAAQWDIITVTPYVLTKLLSVNSVLESLACLECGRLSCGNGDLFLGSGVDSFLFLLVSYLKGAEACELNLVALGESVCDSSDHCVKSLLGILLGKLALLCDFCDEICLCHFFITSVIF